MRLDPDHTQQLYDAGWVDGYDQGRLEGFRRGYRAAIAAAGEPLDRVLAPRPRGGSALTAAGGPPSSGPPAGRTTAASAGGGSHPGTDAATSDGPALIDRARRSWGVPPMPGQDDAAVAEPVTG